MRRRIFLSIASFLIFVFLSIGFGSKAFARSDDGTHGQGNKMTPGAGSMQACQVHEASIKTRMTHLTDLVTNMESKFDSIATRVERYYTNKVVPSGKTIPNYDTLVAAITTKKTAVATALSTAQTDANTFSCTSGTPKAQVTKFRVDMQSVKESLKDYRTAIKNLIVAVHSVTGEDHGTTPTKP